jgi:hypothetical protein
MVVKPLYSTRRRPSRIHLRPNAVDISKLDRQDSATLPQVERSSGICRADFKSETPKQLSAHRQKKKQHVVLETSTDQQCGPI